jgi:V8-like Glu-specific endopeptidase
MLLLTCLLLLPMLIPAQSVNAEDGSLLVFKTFGDPTPQTAPLPTDCTGTDCDSGTTTYYKPFNAFIPSDPSIPPEVNPALWPNAAAVKILSHWPSGAISTCSGMLVEAKFVLTAAHCTFTHSADRCAEGDLSCWADDVEVMPAYQEGSAPAGRSGYESILTWTDWTEGAAPTYDLAAIKLRYPLGAEVGWLGLGFVADDNFYLNNPFALTGYPTTAPDYGETMRFWSGTVSSATSDLLYLADDLDSGWDGASLNAEDGRTYGLVSTIGADTTLVRLTYEKFDAIRTFIEAGQPKEDGGNLTSFMVQVGSDRNFPGQSLRDLEFILWNYSNSALPAGSYPINIYLSSDDQITTDDVYLGTTTFESALEANQGIRVHPEQSFILPEEIRGTEALGGFFYIGAMIDVADANPNDNCTDHFQPSPIWVFNSDNANYLFPIWR